MIWLTVLNISSNNFEPAVGNIFLQLICQAYSWKWAVFNYVSDYSVTMEIIVV